MFQQVIPRSLLWLVSFCAALIIGIIGCGGDDDDNEWVGTWAVETIDGKNLQQQFDAFELCSFGRRNRHLLYRQLDVWRRWNVASGNDYEG